MSSFIFRIFFIFYYNYFIVISLFFYFLAITSRQILCFQPEDIEQPCLLAVLLKMFASLTWDWCQSSHLVIFINLPPLLRLHFSWPLLWYFRTWWNTQLGGNKNAQKCKDVYVFLCILSIKANQKVLRDIKISNPFSLGRSKMFQ